MRYTKRPVTIDAFQWTGDNFPAYCQWHQELSADRTAKGLPLAECTVQLKQDDQRQLEVVTLEGTMVANPGHWIICGVKGELYPCDPQVFAETYELPLSDEEVLVDFKRGADFFNRLPKTMRRALAEILTERGAQDAQWGGPDHDKGHNAAVWVLLILKHLGKASGAWFAGEMHDMRRRLIVCGALLLATLEHAEELQEPTPQEWWRPDGEPGPLPAIEEGTEHVMRTAGSREPGAGSREPK